MRKKSKQSISAIQRKIWEHCKRLIRKMYPPYCYICDKPIAGSNDHTAHFIPKASCGAYLRYDLRNLRRCCYHCNVNLGGNGAEFYRKMVAKEGQEYVDTLFKDKNKTIKAIDHYIKILKDYEETQ